jgi:hypothetical protein
MQFTDVAQNLYSPQDVMKHGLGFLSINVYGKSNQWQTTEFHKHYGSNPLTLASQWFDLCLTDIPEAMLNTEDRSHGGLRSFLIAHYFLWQYPKNSNTLALAFKICERNARGDPIWKWVSRIAALKAKVIVWFSALDARHTEVFALSVDGTDFRVNEKKHPTLNQDKKQCSKKFNHGALKYEIAMSVFEPKCVWIYGPHRGAEHDMTIFRQELKQKIKPWKRIIGDRGYISSQPDERILSTPNKFDSKELAKFKSRARLRQETFNGRLKNFRALKETYRHAQEKHRYVMEAVCVTVQYQMDNGSPIFDV